MAAGGRGGVSRAWVGQGAAPHARGTKLPRKWVVGAGEDVNPWTRPKHVHVGCTCARRHAPRGRRQTRGARRTMPEDDDGAAARRHNGGPERAGRRESLKHRVARRVRCGPERGVVQKACVQQAVRRAAAAAGLGGRLGRGRRRGAAGAGRARVAGGERVELLLPAHVAHGGRSLLRGAQSDGEHAHCAYARGEGPHGGLAGRFRWPGTSVE